MMKIVHSLAFMAMALMPRLIGAQVIQDICDDIESNLNATDDGRPTWFEDDWGCSCTVDPPGLPGGGSAFCSTDERICLDRDIGEPFAGTYSVLTAFNGNGAPQYVARCFQYEQEFDAALTCFADGGSFCAVTIDNRQCESCNICSEMHGGIATYDCSNIGGEVVTDCAASLNGTHLAYLETPGPTMGCPDPPIEDDTVCGAFIRADALNKREGEFYDLFSNPWQCSCIDASQLPFGDAGSACSTGENLCLEGATGEGFNGVYTFLELIQDPLRVEVECFTYPFLYNGAQMCFVKTIDGQCSLSIDGNDCQSCSICPTEEGTVTYNCANVIPGEIVDSCTANSLDGTAFRAFGDVRPSTTCVIPDIVFCNPLEEQVNNDPRVNWIYPNDDFDCTCIGGEYICQTNKFACIQNGDDGDSYSGKFTIEGKYDQSTGSSRRIDNCAQFTSLYDGVKVCLSRNNEIPDCDVCELSINGTLCNSCSFSGPDLPRPIPAADCTNILDGEVFDESMGDSLESTVLRWYAANVQLSDSICVSGTTDRQPTSAPSPMPSMMPVAPTDAPTSNAFAYKKNDVFMLVMSGIMATATHILLLLL